MGSAPVSVFTPEAFDKPPDRPPKKQQNVTSIAHDDFDSTSLTASTATSLNLWHTKNPGLTRIFTGH